MKVDVVINVYGKPWQTLSTLKSLKKWSDEHIDKIYLIKEGRQPYNDNVDWIFEHIDNLVVHTASNYSLSKYNCDYSDDIERLSIRHQYGFEKSDKKFLFITHNDVLYTGDIIGDMLSLIEDSIGIGEFGQCWNCPAKHIGMCSGEKFNEWNPTEEDFYKLPLPHVRTNINNVNRTNIKPLPECRLNEWCCLINREMSNNETYPNGNTPLFGFFGLDSGTEWFKSLYFKNYTFKDYRKNYIHGYWANNAGHPTLQNKSLYDDAEKNAKKYYEENF